MINYNEAKKILNDNDNEHILDFYNELDEKEKEYLLNQISNIDFTLINNLKNKLNQKIDSTNCDISPIPFIDKSKISKEDLEKYKKIGSEIIKNGGLAVVTMAGGQGTRLGHDGPKGTFKLDIPNKTIFEILCENLKRAKEKYSIYIPWYIMTSLENNEDTISFFENNNYFGYPKEYVKFFKQGQLPVIDNKGKLLLEDKWKIKLAPDGHGGLFEAMHKNNIINDMNLNGIKWVFISGVDNILARMVDPIEIGISEYMNVQITGESLVKANPHEKVGVFCKRNGKPSVIEYSEISDELAEKTDENDELCFGEAHILCNMFNIQALNKIGTEKLPYHSAFKKGDYIDNNGNKVIANEPNIYKFESFIFDAFEKIDNMLILRVKREEAFAPIKNAQGVDSPETATNLYINYWKNN